MKIGTNKLLLLLLFVPTSFAGESTTGGAVESDLQNVYIEFKDFDLRVVEMDEDLVLPPSVYKLETVDDNEFDDCCDDCWVDDFEPFDFGHFRSRD